MALSANAGPNKGLQLIVRSLRSASAYDSS